jgi:hypothetical protein
MLVLALTAAASAGVVAVWIADRRRFRRRNERGGCGACGDSLADSGDSYLIHGRLVCGECAARARRRMPWELGGLAVWVALVTSIGAASLLVGNGAGIAALIVVPTILVPVGTVQLMKLANRRAQLRISGGEFPGLGGRTGARRRMLLRLTGLRSDTYQPPG